MNSKVDIQLRSKKILRGVPFKIFLLRDREVANYLCHFNPQITKQQLKNETLYMEVGGELMPLGDIRLVIYNSLDKNVKVKFVPTMWFSCRIKDFQERNWKC